MSAAPSATDPTRSAFATLWRASPGGSNDSQSMSSFVGSETRRGPVVARTMAVVPRLDVGELLLSSACVDFGDALVQRPSDQRHVARACAGAVLSGRDGRGVVIRVRSEPRNLFGA